jgi:hypothetical protein
LVYGTMFAEALLRDPSDPPSGVQPPPSAR